MKNACRVQEESRTFPMPPNVSVAYVSNRVGFHDLMSTLANNEWVLFPFQTSLKTIRKGHHRQLILGDSLVILTPTDGHGVRNMAVYSFAHKTADPVKKNGKPIGKMQPHAPLGFIFQLRGVTLIHDSQKNPPLPGPLMETIHDLLQRGGETTLQIGMVYVFDAESGQPVDTLHRGGGGGVSGICQTCGGRVQGLYYSQPT